MKILTTWIICLLITPLCTTIHANPDVLEKLRSRHEYSSFDLINDFFLMEDDALPFLIQTLSDKNPNARQRAAYLLRDYFGDPSALSALSVTFLHDTDNEIRNAAARTIANIDAEYAKKFLAKHINADKDTQDIVLNVLLNLKDRRVIPPFVKRLKDPNTRPEKRRFAAYALSDFKDKRAIPVLLDILKYPGIIKIRTLEEVIEKLANIDDEQITPILLNVLDHNSPLGNRSSDSLRRKIVKTLSQSGMSCLQSLLEILKQTESNGMRHSLLQVLREVHDPKLAPIFGKKYLQTDDFALSSTIIDALQNMGDEGFENLLSLSSQKPDEKVLSALASFNKKAAVDTIAGFALDRSSPLRYNAIGMLAEFGNLQKVEVSKYIPQLLADPNPKVKFLTLDLIRQVKLTEVAPALKQLTQDPDENIRNAAHLVLDILSRKTQLKLDVEPDQPRYDYGQPVKLTYRLKNVSNYHIKIATMPNTHLIEKLDIQQPDGTSARFLGTPINFSGSKPENYKTIHPGAELTDTIFLSQSAYWLHQSGRYTVNLHIIPWGTDVKHGFLAWPYTISTKVHFNIEPPTNEQLEAILARIDAGDYTASGRTYHQLCELNKSGAFPTLKKRALIPFDNLGRYTPKSIADWLGSKFLKLSNDELIPKCIEMLHHSEVMITIVGQLGNEQAIEPLRKLAFRGRKFAVVALQELGDEKTVTAMKKLLNGGRNWHNENSDIVTRKTV